MWGIVVLGLGVAAVLVPLAALVHVSRAVDCGAVAELSSVAVVGFGLAPTLTVGGLLALRGRSFPTAGLLAVVVTPLLASMPVAQAEGDVVFACAVAATACLLVAVSHVGSIASIDRARVGGRRGPIGVSLLLGGVWFVAALSVRVVFRLTADAASGAGPAAAVLASVASGLATATAPVLGEWHDRGEAREARWKLLVAAAAATLWVALIDRAALAHAETAMSTALACSTAPEVWYRVFAANAASRSGWGWAMAVDVVFCVASFAVAVGASWPRARWSTRQPQ